MKILVTGGAGYIGSAAVKSLIKQGYEVIVVDNLSKGKKELIDPKARFYEIDLTNKQELLNVFSENKIDIVMHFAAYKSVEESMENAVEYSDNIMGTINLLNLMVKFDIKKIIFSSTAAVYESGDSQINEDSPTNPINFYGFTKLESEKIIKWYSKIHNIQYIIFRYFNVAGDTGLKYVDPNAKNIFPLIMEVLKGRNQKLTIFGDNYNTPDGTCIRDYIDINHLINAHILALNINSNEIINLGSGKGYSVKELVDTFNKTLNKEILYNYGIKRKGDPALLLTSIDKAKQILKWSPEKTLQDMIKSTYEAYK